MPLIFAVLSVFGLLFSSPHAHAEEVVSDANREKAANAEKRAFKHIEGEKWCKATNAFLDAYDYHAAVVYIYNAAKAAEFAKDRKLALQLSLEMMGKFPGSDKQAEVNEMIQALSKEVTSLGPGTPCPRDKQKEPEPAPAPVAPEPAPPAPQAAPETPPPAPNPPAPVAAPTEPQPEPAPVDPTPAAPATDEKSNENGNLARKSIFAPENGGVYMGVGVAMMGSGAILLGITSMPYNEMEQVSAEHAQIKQQIQANPDNDGLILQGTDLQNQYNSAASTFDTYLYSGISLTAAGAVFTGLGLYLKSLEPPPEQ